MPDKRAVVLAETGASLSYRELENQANQVAHFFRSVGLQRGRTVVFHIENCLEIFPLLWGAQRIGLYFVCLSTRLTAEELIHIINDCDAALLVASARIGGVDWMREKDRLAGRRRLSVGGEIPGFDPIEPLLRGQPTAPVADQSAGVDMLYSSGTTGRPKGVRVSLPDNPFDAATPIVGLLTELYGFSAQDVYLAPAPLYHAAPLRWCMAMQRLGATAVVMQHFDARLLLQLIERYRVTGVQLVPTMLVRLLKLPEEVRAAYDLTSLRIAIHSAAPCPMPIKRAMIDWWGPIVHEYYAGTEGNGLCSISAEEWCRRPGSVGQAKQGELHICDDEGNELPPGKSGTVYFAGGRVFEYFHDDRKTRESRHPIHPHWSTLGDVGYIDEEGYLYLTDRKAFMIISGGVNVYPQETENILILHPKVADVAVFGVPDEDLGEAVKAVIQPTEWKDAGSELERELIAYARAYLSPIKCPKSVDFERELPRSPTGKLSKKLLKDRYWQAKGVAA